VDLAETKTLSHVLTDHAQHYEAERDAASKEGEVIDGLRFGNLAYHLREAAEVAGVIAGGSNGR
jgi:hypothetical protein